MRIFDGNKIIIDHVTPIKLHQPKNFKIECAIYRNTPPNGYITLSYVLKGQANFKYSDKTITARKGDIIYLDNYNPFVQTVTEDFWTYNINIRVSGGFLLEPCIYKPDNPEKFLVKFKEAVHAHRSKNVGYPLKVIGIIYQILSELQYEFSTSSNTEKQKEIFLESKKYINENLSNPNLTVEAVAKKVNISPGYLWTVFNEFTDMSTSSYIKTTRINYGADLISTGSFSVNEVARLCGFLSVSHFIKEFKSILGCTPLSFKNNNQEIYHSRKEGLEKSNLAKEYVHESQKNG